MDLIQFGSDTVSGLLNVGSFIIEFIGYLPTFLGFIFGILRFIIFDFCILFILAEMGIMGICLYETSAITMGVKFIQYNIQAGMYLFKFFTHVGKFIWEIIDALKIWS